MTDVTRISKDFMSRQQAEAQCQLNEAAPGFTCVLTEDGNDWVFTTTVALAPDPGDAAPPEQGVAPSTPGASLTLASVAANRRATAQQVIDAFAAAGYGLFQQAAAVANAIAESALDPHALTVTSKERSLGLFQLNTKGGLGAGHSDDELFDPVGNTRIILKQAAGLQAFKSAATLADAVSVFVREIERPADANGEVARRLVIAQRLVA